MNENVIGRDILVENPAAHVKLVRLNRPHSLNALTIEMVEALVALFAELRQDRDCRVLIITGQGGFCAGLDLKAAATRNAQVKPSSLRRMAFQEMFAGMILGLRAMPQIVVAGINGACAGAGFGIALASDVRIASPAAKFLVGASRIGLSAGECGISYHLPRIVGAGRAFDIMITGRNVDATEAERIGLVTTLVPETQIEEALLDYASRIVELAPFSSRVTKKMLWNNLNASSLESALELENHAQVVAAMSPDYAEAMIAFAEKRKPNFTGE